MSETMELTREALTLVMLLAAPSVVVAALAGLLIAFIQAATQLQEQSFQYAVKFFAVVVTIFVTASFTGATLFEFTSRIFSEFPTLITQ